MNDISMGGKNRHPVDELFDVRQQIKELETREKSLKEQVGALMGNRDSLGGDECIASQSISSRKGGFDETKLKAKLGDDLAEFRKPDIAVITIKVERRAVDEVA